MNFYCQNTILFFESIISADVSITLGDLAHGKFCDQVILCLKPTKASLFPVCVCVFISCVKWSMKSGVIFKWSTVSGSTQVILRLRSYSA